MSHTTQPARAARPGQLTESDVLGAYQADGAVSATLPASFGYFDRDGREFVVTTLQTPRPLVNYFWNQRFISGISHHAGGEGVYKERTMQFIDPADRSLLVREGHRYFYLRDEADGQFWSPGWHPVHAPIEDYSCRHGLGYSILQSRRDGIATRMRVFVPADDPCEIWTITLTNERSTAATLKLYSFADWLLAGYPRYCDYYGFLTGQYIEDVYAAQGCNRAYERRHPVYDAFVASDTKPTGFETSRDAFLGPFGYPSAPRAVVEGACRNSLAACEKLASALEHTIELEAGESQTLQIFIGASSGGEMTRRIVGRLSRPGVVEDEFEALVDHKDAMARRVQIRTPDRRVDYLINGWIKQQMQIYADVGSDNGRGFRDAMQMLWATASYDAAYTRRMLIECLSHQFADGHTLRGWLPIDDHHYSDGPVWISPVVEAYLRETGDMAFLDEVVPFYGGGEGTVREHVLRAMRHSSDDVGAHGLVRMHYGDWNDSLNGVGNAGIGETVWGSIAIIYSMRAAERIFRQDGCGAEADDMLQRIDRMTAAVNEHGWDGEWYLRAYNDVGEKIGTHTEEQGRMYLIPQVWAVLAGICDEQREKQIWSAVDENLEFECGCVTLWPTYTKSNPNIGRLTELVPGMWENGSPYTHANGFKIVADCMAGRGDAAYRTLRKILPDSQWNPSTESGCEPYVMTNQQLGPDNPRAGSTLWAWMTGSASWAYRAVTEWILGVRADYDGLRIDPCLPADWDGASLVRDFRGARYQVRISNPHGLQTGRAEIFVDGERLDGNLAPIFGDGETHTVEVTLHPR